MNLLENLKFILLEDLASQIQQIKDKYVGEGKPMNEDDFAKIEDVSNGKFYIIAWLSKRVGSGMIKTEDIYKYKEYFDIFEKNKNKFTHKDINLYKTAEDLQKFIDEVIQVREGNIIFDEITGKDNYVSQKDIEKLESTKGIKYLGMFDGYQVFQIFKVAKDVWKMYRDILGKCKGRSRGAKIDICTIGDYYYFKEYLTDPKGSSYFLLYNLDDPKSPYQLHYESGQFMDKNDSSRIGINQIKFFEWIGDRVPRYSLEQDKFPGDFEIPIKGKGFQDDKKRKQGLWKNFESGRLNKISEYVNGVLRNYIEYFENGKVNIKGTQDSKGRADGEYVSYYTNGTIHAKGNFNHGHRIGVWIESDNDGFTKMIDYSKDPIELTGITKSGKIRYVSQLKNYSDEGRLYGDTIIFYPSGSVNAIGKYNSSLGPMGDWTYYLPDGRIKAQGKYVKEKRQGEWTDLVKNKKGVELILVAHFENGKPKKDIKIYDKMGNFLKKVEPTKIKPLDYFDLFLPLSSFRY